MVTTIQVFLACLALAQGTLAPGGAGYEETIERYAVHGGTLDEIYTSLVRRGPAVTGLNGAIASHRPQFVSRYETAQTPDGCQVVRTDFKLKSTLKIPRWDDRGRSDPKLAAAMAAYEASLLKHERTHARIARNFLGRLEARILALPPAQTCNGLRLEIERLRAEEYRRERREQAAFHRLDGVQCWPFTRCPNDDIAFRQLSVNERGALARVLACRRKLGMSDGYGVVRLSHAEFERRCGG